LIELVTAFRKQDMQKKSEKNKHNKILVEWADSSFFGRSLNKLPLTPNPLLTIFKFYNSKTYLPDQIIQLYIKRKNSTYIEWTQAPDMKNIFYQWAITPVLLLLLNPFVTAQELEKIRIAPLPHNLYWENKPEQSTITQENIVIVAGEKTDMFRDPNVTYNTDNAPKLLFIPDSNFVLSTAITHDFIHKWDGGAIVLKSDSLNWIKFCFEKDYTGTHRVVSVVTKDISDDCNSVAINGNKIYYKIAKAGNVITLYYATDGKIWYLIRHLQFNAKGGSSLGFLAQSPTGTKCSVTFSDIHYAAKKIKDPYLGE